MIKLTFKKFDTDKSGSIDINELKKACESIGISVGSNEL